MNLLIVDDEIYAIQGILDGIDWDKQKFDEVLTANSFSQAVNIFMDKEVDILLCDIEMPHGNGIELVKWVKGHYPKTICIFLTCHSDFDFARQAIKLDCFDYILKPVAYSKLLNVLNDAVQHSLNKEEKMKYEDYGKRYVKELSKEENEEKLDNNEIDEIVKDYIQKHISEEISIEEIARLVYLSPDHLTRVFKKKNNDQTLISYIIEQRMFLAKELLKQNKLSISMISAKVGYSNYSYFTKLFKKHYGKTPSQYQREHSNKS